MAMQTSDMVSRIDPAQSFDTDARLRYAMANVDGFPQPISESNVSQDRVIGILNWELSTLRNQMCDVAYSCLHYIVDISLDKLQEHEGFESTGIPDGIPSLAKYLAYYCAAAGNAAGGKCASHVGQKADAMVEIAWAFINRGSVTRQYPPGTEDDGGLDT